MKEEKLLEIAKEIEKCEECKKEKYGLPVPGEGNPDAKIIFLGMAPGFNESKIGKPFVGRAGKFLDKLLVLLGIKREEIFITSPLKYYPGRRSIKAWEIEHGKIHLQKQIEIIQPKLIVLLGEVAVKATLGKRYKLLEIHGKLIEKEGIFYFPTFHPAAAMRFPKIKELTIKDFEKLKKIKEEMKL